VLKGNEGPSLTCFRCGKTVWPRCGAYWFLLLAPRGRVVFPAAPSRALFKPKPTEARAVLCAFCGRQLRELVEEGAFAPGEAYERVGSGGRSGVSGTSGSGDDGGEGGSDLVDDFVRGESSGVEGFRELGECFPPGIG
jgi:uncharacterized membrane protein YgcG